MTNLSEQSQTPSNGAVTINKLLNSGAAVPLFIPQTFISTLRDVGYNSTTSALCEHVDNAVQAEATEIRIYFNQSGKHGSYEMDTLILDNGKGMEPAVLQLSMSFGGSMSYNDRNGIGRFGVGMKTAALSMSPSLDVYSWVEPKAFYRMSLDTIEIASNSIDALSLSEPELVPRLPDEIADILTSQMEYPRNNLDRVASSPEELPFALGSSGTIIYLPKCDRLSYKMAKTLVDYATYDMSRIYREHIGKGVKIYINNRLLKATDPVYWMKNAVHTKLDVLKDIEEKHSKLVNTWQIDIPVSEDSETTAPVSVRLYELPYESWGKLSKADLTKRLNLYDRHLVTVLRNEREVFAGIREGIFKSHGDTLWTRVRIDFSGELDEAFGVAMNKQGIRPKKYVEDRIRIELQSDIARIRGEVAKWRKNKNNPKPKTGELTESERRAKEADPHQGKPLPSPKADSPEEKAEIAANIRGLSIALKREGESDDEAYTRVDNSTFITAYSHDEYHPFYTLETKYGKVILTINKAHRFYTDLYAPLSEMVVEAINGEENGEDGYEQSTDERKKVLTALEMMLFSLGRTQTILVGDDEVKAGLYRDLHIEWSKTLQKQLMTE